MWILGLNGLKLMRKMIMTTMVINVKRAKMKNRTIGDKDNDKQDHDCDFDYFPRDSRSLYVSGLQMPTYPSPKPTFCPKWEASVYVGLRKG